MQNLNLENKITLQHVKYSIYYVELKFYFRLNKNIRINIFNVVLVVDILYIFIMKTKLKETHIRKYYLKEQLQRR